MLTSMIPNLFTSTKEKPLENFIYLFERNGFQNFRDSFFHSDEETTVNELEYDPKTETKTYIYYNHETGDISESKLVFKDYYYKYLCLEFKITCKNIEDYIYDQKNEESISTYLKLNLIKLKKLLTIINRNKEINRYDANANSINAIINFIHKEFNVFIDDIKISLDRNSPSNNRKTSSNDSFNILTKGSKKEIATDLFDILQRNRYVDISSKADFISTFMGKPQTNKIKWIGHFGDLKTFINQCHETELIEKTPRKWVIVSNTFTENKNNIDPQRINNTKECKDKTKITMLVNSIKKMTP